MNLNKGTGAFLQMVLSVLGIVLWVTMFSSIMTAFNNIYSGATSLTNFIAFGTVLSIAPSILFIAGVFGGAFLYYKGYKKAIGSGVNSLLIMVLGALEIILFVTLFTTIITAMSTLDSTTNLTNYIAMQTVVRISPTILFLGGIFAGGMTAVGGWRSRKKGRR